MNMNEQPLIDTIMEVREEFMLSPAGDSEPTLRTAHFLQPISNSIYEPAFKLNLFSPSSSSVFEPNECPLETHFQGWHYTTKKWVSWIDKLQQKYESVWRKAGIFEAIMSTKCYIHKNYNLLFGIVEKWCSETNTFVFPFGEATITLEDIMVLGGYPILGDPIFTQVKDQEMREVEKKLILALKQLTTDVKQGGNSSRRKLWMDIFIHKGSEIEHEAFLVTWLSLSVFPHKLSWMKSSLFPIAVLLARGNPIALAPAVLASIYNDLTLFKKTIVNLSKYHVGSDRYPLQVTLQSPFYLVQIWVWERFKNLQPQPMLLNHRDPFLFRWHKVKPLIVDNVRMTLDSAMDDFLWRPYVRYSDKCELFYPNDEILVPFKKDLDTKMISFVICLRVSELVGFECIEQYLPHRVAMQFGIDQDVPGYVARFNETIFIAWKNYCRPIYDKNLYFPSRLFEADVTTRYARWWMQSVFPHDDFEKKIVRRKRSSSSRKRRPHVGKFNGSGIEVCVNPGFSHNLVDTLTFGNVCDDGSNAKTRKVNEFCVDVPYENSVHDCLRAYQNIDADGSSILPPKHNTLVPSISVENCQDVLEEYSCIRIIDKSKHLEKELKDTDGRKELRIASDKVCLLETQGDSCSYAIRNEVSLSNSEFGDFISSNVDGEMAGYCDEDETKSPFYDRNGVNDINGEIVEPFTLDMEFDLENRIEKLEKVVSKLKEARFGEKVENV